MFAFCGTLEEGSSDTTIQFESHKGKISGGLAPEVGRRLQKCYGYRNSVRML